MGRHPIRSHASARHGAPPGIPIVRAITRLNVGGPARQALLLSKELRPDFDTTLTAGKPEATEGELADPEVAMHRVSLVRRIHPQLDVKAFLGLRKLFGSIRPRLVHTHMAKAGALGRAAATTMRPRPKVVHTYHGHVFESYFGSLAEKTFLNIERALAKKTDVLVAISPEVKQSLLELGVGREEQYRTIPLGFDLSEHLDVDHSRGALRSKLGLRPETPLIGSVGRLVPIKDLATLLKAMTHVPDAHLAVLGDGEVRGELEGLARELGLGECVHFIGWFTDIPTAMSDMDLVVLSSLNEGTPVSLIEAAACAKPVVATDVGGVPYVVDHDRTGLLCPPRDPEALAAHIRTLMADRDRRRRMGDAGREKVRRLFHKDRLVRDIRELYSELLA